MSATAAEEFAALVEDLDLDVDLDDDEIEELDMSEKKVLVPSQFVFAPWLI